MLFSSTNEGVAATITTNEGIAATGGIVTTANSKDTCIYVSKRASRDQLGAKGLGVLPHLPIFRQFFHFHKNPSSHFRHILP
jgi:hypothetical protein